MKAKPPEKIQQAADPSTRGYGNEMNRKQRREMMRKIQSEDLSIEVVHPQAAGTINQRSPCVPSCFASLVRTSPKSTASML